MQQLPDAFAKHDVQILNSKGEFKMNQTYHPWIHFCKRVPNFFEIQASGKSGKEYANAVYFKLLELQPTDKTADKVLKNLATFLCNVDKIACDQHLESMCYIVFGNVRKKTGIMKLLVLSFTFIDAPMNASDLNMSYFYLCDHHSSPFRDIQSSFLRLYILWGLALNSKFNASVHQTVSQSKW